MMGRIILVCLIYRKAGGKQVRRRLEMLEMEKHGLVQMMGTVKGNVDRELWPQILRMFAQRTVYERGVIEGGSKNWRYAVVLYVDCYGVHMSKSVARRMARDYGIFVRPLLRNCSHIQQPVDRHIGRCLKALYKCRVTDFTFMLQHMLKMSCFSEEMAVQKYTELCAGAIQHAVQQVKYRSDSVHNG